MSIVVIPGGPESKITPREFDELLAAVDIQHVTQQDKQDYLAVLQSFEAVMNKVDSMPDYIPAPLSSPQPPVANRSFRQPTAAENPLNAWRFCCEIAVETTAATGKKAAVGRLSGRTMAVKDNISVAGLPTTLGTSPLLFGKDGDTDWASSAIDATVVARLLAAGAVVRGTSTCEAFCASPQSNTSFTGPVQHPRLAGHSAGGSSSGSAVLVASGVVDLAIGSDQAGSVRIPASYTGVYGLKPTFGLVPYTGAGSMSPMIDHLGPLATSLEDVAVMLEVMAGYDGLDPRMSPEAPLMGCVKPYEKILRDFKASLSSSSPPPPLCVGLLTESFAVPGLTPVVRDTVMAAAKSYFAAAGATLVDVSVPLHADGAVIWNAATRPSMSAFLLQGRCSGQLTLLPPHMRPRWPRSGGQEAFEVLHAHNPAAVNVLLSQAAVESELVDARLEAKAHRLVFALRAAYDAALRDNNVDVLVTPCAPDLARPLPPDDASAAVKMAYGVGTTNNTGPFNVTGHPALSVPCGWVARPEHPDVPLPVGMQLVGRRFEDERVLMAAALFDEGRKLVDKAT